jgi:hypothetical protein
MSRLIDDPLRFGDRYGRQLGYTVGDYATVSKIRALEQANGDPSKIQFHWHEDRFDHVDWTQEPKEDLSTLVFRRVMQLRQNHDHIALWYSGGFDSHTIIEAFRQCRCQLDEVVIQSREWLEDQDHIEFRTAMASAHWYKKHVWPDLKITTVKWQVKDALHYYRTVGSDWIYHNGDVLRFSKHSRDLLLTLNSGVIGLSDRPGRSLQINGFDKPRLDVRDGKWFSTRTDKNLYYEMDDVALQFWILPELYVKQCWMMVRWLESLGYKTQQDLHAFVHQLQSNKTSGLIYEQWNLALGRCQVPYEYQRGNLSKLIWQGIRTNTESLTFLNTARVDYTDVYGFYETGLQHIEKEYAHIMTEHGLPGILSRPYFIKDLEIK